MRKPDYVSLRVTIARPIYYALVALVEMARAGEECHAAGRVTVEQQAAEYAENSIVERFELVFHKKIKQLAREIEAADVTDDARAEVIARLVGREMERLQRAPLPSVEEQVEDEFRGLTVVPNAPLGAQFRKLLAR